MNKVDAWRPVMWLKEDHRGTVMRARMSPTEWRPSEGVRMEWCIYIYIYRSTGHVFSSAPSRWVELGVQSWAQCSVLSECSLTTFRVQSPGCQQQTHPQAIGQRFSLSSFFLVLISFISCFFLCVCSARLCSFHSGHSFLFFFNSSSLPNTTICPDDFRMNALSWLETSLGPGPVVDVLFVHLFKHLAPLV